MSFRPLGDYVLVRPENTTEGKHGLVLPSVLGNLVRGEVIATGDGTYRDGTWVASSVNPGQVVVYDKRAGTELVDNDETFTLLPETQLLGIIE